jgi:hypothetical protein
MTAEKVTESGASRRQWLLGLQAGILTFAAIVFALLPPDKGPILLVSLSGHSAAGLIGADLRLIGAGRLPGSLVVTGVHPSFTEALFRHGVLIFPVMPILCGGGDKKESE